MPRRCAASLGGTNLNLDLALDVAYAVKTLIDPELKLTGFASNDEANANWEGAYKAITAAGRDVTNGVRQDPDGRCDGRRAGTDEDLRRFDDRVAACGPGPSRS